MPERKKINIDPEIGYTDSRGLTRYYPSYHKLQNGLNGETSKHQKKTVGEESKLSKTRKLTSPNRKPPPRR